MQESLVWVKLTRLVCSQPVNYYYKYTTNQSNESARINIPLNTQIMLQMRPPVQQIQWQ